MNGYDYGNRLPPMLRTRDVSYTAVNAAVTQVLPDNPHRWGVLLESPYSGVFLYYFSIAAPTASTGIPITVSTGRGILLSYCDVGNLIWRSLWVYQATAADVSAHVYELSLPKEAWDVILSQALLPGRPS